MLEASVWDRLLVPLLPAVGWLANYLIHSTLLLTLGLLAAGALGARRLAAQEVVLRAALLAGVVTASLVGLPGAGDLAIWSHQPVALPVTARAAAPSPVAPSAEPSAAAERPATTGGARQSSVVDGLEAPALERGDGGWWRPSLEWVGPLTALWLAGALLLTGQLALRHALLSHRLRHRSILGEGPLYALFRRLLSDADPEQELRLASCDRLVVPIARGIRRPEVCVPEGIGRDLTIEEQATVLAHESAHLLRRDPAWLAVYRLFEAMLFLQPLNRLVCRRLIELAEYRCDDWAVRRTGRPITLAKCLTHFASWRVSGALSLASTMAGAKGGLGGRVERLLARDYPRPPRPLPRWLVPVAAGVVLAVAVVAPRVAPASEKPAGIHQASEPGEPAAPAPASAPSAASPALPATEVLEGAPADPVGPAEGDGGLVRWYPPRFGAGSAGSDGRGSKDRWDERDTDRWEDRFEDRVDDILDAASEDLEDGWDGMAEDFEDDLDRREDELDALGDALENAEDDFDNQIDRLDDRLDRLEERLERREEAGNSVEVTQRRREVARLRVELRRLESWSDAASGDLEDRLEEDAQRSLMPAREVLTREVERREAAELGLLEQRLEAAGASARLRLGRADQRRAQLAALESEAKQLQQEAKGRMERERVLLERSVVEELAQLANFAVPRLRNDLDAELVELRAAFDERLAALQAAARAASSLRSQDRGEPDRP